jgi:hypothetical protein
MSSLYLSFVVALLLLYLQSLLKLSKYLRGCFFVHIKNIGIVYS